MGLFFFDKDSGPFVKDLQSLPADGEGLLKILASLSAKAGVVSGYDGNEWLVGGVPANQAIAS